MHQLAAELRATKEALQRARTEGETARAEGHAQLQVLRVRLEETEDALGRARAELGTEKVNG